WFDNTINLDILLFAAPAALIGGTLARAIAGFLSPTQLKITIAIWVLISAVVM
ncbi:MAG: putative membrane protein YfcA, partial [Cryomorphaceae bacterium]